MSYKIDTIANFRKEAKRLIKKYPSLKIEIAKLAKVLEQKPDLGIPIGNNCYKIRIAIASKNKGKSGGARIITYVLVNDTTVFLLSIYDKSEQNNITSKELTELTKLIR